MKTLIYYATKHGTAEKCARLLAQKLDGQIDLVKAGDGDSVDLDTYDRVIIGGSIYVGKIQKEITEFCQKYLSKLTQKKLGLFICSMMKQDERKQISLNFPKELLDAANTTENFGAEIKYGELGFMERTITKMVFKLLSKENPSLVDPKQGISALETERLDCFVMKMM
jgi:menaquinone-dependent protoporphyrinogen oxidase